MDNAVEREAEAVTKEVTSEREVGVVEVEEEGVSRVVVVAGKREEVEVEMTVVVVSSVVDSLVELLVVEVVVSSSSSVVVVLLEDGVLVVDVSSSSSVLEVVGVGLSLMVVGLLDVVGVSLLRLRVGELCAEVSVTSTLVVLTVLGIPLPCLLACLRILSPASMAATRFDPFKLDALWLCTEYHK